MQNVYILKIVKKTNQGINVFYKLWFDKANSWLPHGRPKIGSFLKYVHEYKQYIDDTFAKTK